MPTYKVSESMPLSEKTGRRRKPGEPEDLPISAFFLLSGRTAKIDVQIFSICYFSKF
jgi:hypothetical protein